ncbi:hypothetical protein ACLB1Q_19090 [Escherichia coli]
MMRLLLYYAPEVFKTLGASTDIALLQTIIRSYQPHLHRSGNYDGG